MEARVGDRIIVESSHVGGGRRVGAVVEILEVAGVVHYRVRWEDGHESVFLPSSDAHVEPASRR